MDVIRDVVRNRNFRAARKLQCQLFHEGNYGCVSRDVLRGIPRNLLSRNIVEVQENSPAR